MAVESKGVAFILLVEGCETAPVDMSQFNGIPIRLITVAEDTEGFFKEVKGVFA